VPCLPTPRLLALKAHVHAEHAHSNRSQSIDFSVGFRARSHSSGGTVPLSMGLEYNVSDVIFVRVASSDGIDPVSWLPWSQRSSNSLAAPSSRGIGPAKPFVCSHKEVREASPPSSVGMADMRLLYVIHTFVALRSVPSSGGSDPVGPVAASRRSTSRPALPIATVGHGRSLEVTLATNYYGVRNVT
jgi:hypothetical protein